MQPAFKKSWLKTWIHDVVLGLLIVPGFYVYSNEGEENFTLKLFSRCAVVVFLFWATLISNRGKVKLPKDLGAVTVYAFLFLACCSIPFSSNINISAIKSFDLLFFLFFGIFISNTKQSFDEVMTFVSRLLSIYILGFFFVSSTFDLSIFRTMGIDGQARLGGSIINPNLLAYCLVSLLIIHLQSFRVSGALVRAPMLIFFVAGLLMTYSRSAIVVAAAVVFLFLESEDPKNRKRIVVFKLYIMPLSLFAFFINYGNILSLLERGHGLENVLTLGGRTTIWGLQMDAYYREFNFFGYGYQMLSENGVGIESVASMAHNNLLQSLLGLGLFGLLLNATILIQLIYISIIAKKKIGAPVFFLQSFFFMIVIFSLVEFGVFGPSNIITPIFFVVLFSFKKFYGRTSSNTKAQPHPVVVNF